MKVDSHERRSHLEWSTTLEKELSTSWQAEEETFGGNLHQFLSRGILRNEATFKGHFTGPHKSWGVFCIALLLSFSANQQTAPRTRCWCGCRAEYLMAVHLQQAVQPLCHQKMLYPFSTFLWWLDGHIISMLVPASSTISASATAAGGVCGWGRGGRCKFVNWNTVVLEIDYVSLNKLFYFATRHFDVTVSCANTSSTVRWLWHPLTPSAVWLTMRSEGRRGRKSRRGTLHSIRFFSGSSLIDRPGVSFGHFWTANVKVNDLCLQSLLQRGYREMWGRKVPVQEVVSFLRDIVWWWLLGLLFIHARILSRSYS